MVVLYSRDTASDKYLLKTTLNQSWMQDKEVQFYAQQIKPYNVSHGTCCDGIILATLAGEEAEA